MSVKGETEKKIHPFYRSNSKGTPNPISGKLTGKIPEWLQGSLIRNGPGIQDIGADRYVHLFDGLAVLHKFKIQNGQVTYQSKPLESDTYKKNMEAQKIVVSEFGTFGIEDPCSSFFSRLKATFSPAKAPDVTDNCLVNVAYHGDQLYAMTEVCFLRRIDPEDLSTIGEKTRITDYVTMDSATAHPHVLEDGTVLNMGNNYKNSKGPHYCIVKVPPVFDGSDESNYKNAKIIAQFPMRWKTYPCYYHSFGMTKDKVIFIEQPLCFNVLKIMARNLTKTSILDTFKWYQNYPTRFYISSMENGEIHPIIYETDKLFTFHHINAYEENDQLIVDVAGYQSGNVVLVLQQKLMDEKGMSSIEGANARRYILPLKIPEGAKIGDNLVTIPNTTATAKIKSLGGGKESPVIELTYQNLSEKWVEFPRINYKYNGQKYRYFYVLESDNINTAGLPIENIITKMDVDNPESPLRWRGEGIMASEPIFVANPNGGDDAAEDDGVILTALLHENEENKTTFLILSAKDMSEITKVEFDTDGPITGTFHGQWSHAGQPIHTY